MNENKMPEFSAAGKAGILWTNGEWDFRREGGDWTRVAVPHDWAIAGPFDPDAEGGCGKLPWQGKGEYRRVFRLVGFEAARAAGETFDLEFDGVMARPQVFVNGVFAGGWDYGYMSFRLDATEFLREGENEVRVLCDTTQIYSRWYPGAGLYRDVRLVKRARAHVVPGSLAITTTSVTAETATIHVAYRSSTEGSVAFDRTVDHPRLWDVEDPFLYEIEILGETFRYGIRTAEFTADDGFHLNGRRVQLHGANLHADLGPLGMAFDLDAMKRQLLLMKDMGVNAIRTSHNPCDPKVLDLCDEMGFLVWNECFDKWDSTAGRRPDENLEAYVVRNLRQFVRRDRNHPCVVVWSIGNEIPTCGPAEQPAPDAYSPNGTNAARFREFRAAIRELDATRPVGIGCCYQNAIESGMFSELDITGWNYHSQYRPFRKKYPTIPVLYSESGSSLSEYGYLEDAPANGQTAYDYEGFRICGFDHCAASWGDIADHEFDAMETDRYCAGEFVWSGIDYLGEPWPYGSYNRFGPLENVPLSKLARSAYFGTVDLMGVPKERFFLYRSYWNDRADTVHILPHWNHKDGPRAVFVYTNGDEAELFLNGRSLGRRRKATKPEHDPLCPDPYYDVCAKYRLRWFGVPYEPGELVAVAYRNGKEIGRDTMRTAAAPVAVRLTDDPYNAPGAKTRFVQVDLVDEAGTRDPLSMERVFFSLEGPGEIVAVGNGDPRAHESFRDVASHPLRYGKAVAVVRRSGEGRLVLHATCGSLREAVLEIP